MGTVTSIVVIKLLVMDLIDQESPAIGCLAVDVIVIGILLHRGKQVHHRIDLGSAEYVRLHPTINFRKLPYEKTLLNQI